MIVSVLILLYELFYYKIIGSVTETNINLDSNLYGFIIGQQINLNYVSSYDFLAGNIIWKKKYYTDTSNLNYCSNTYMVEPKEEYKKDFGINISLFQEYHATYYSLSNVFFSSDNIIAIPVYEMLVGVKPLVFNKGYISGLKNSTINNTELTIRGHFKKAILAYGAYTWTYGHFYWDVLVPLMLFPKEAFIGSCVFVSDDMFHIARESLKLCYGIPPENVLKDYDRTIYYADKLFYYTSVSLALGHIYQTKNFTKMFLKKARIKHENPYMFCFQNRNHFIRPIENFDILVEATRKQFNQYEWTVLPTEYFSFIDSAKDFSKIKLVIMPSGSGLFNTLFMQEKGVVIDFMTEEFNQNDVYLAFSADLHLIAFLGCRNCNHFKASFSINPESLFPVIDAGISLIQNRTSPILFKRYNGTKCWTE